MDASKRVRAFALDVPHLRSLQKGHAPSSKQERVNDWLLSEAGRTWLAERARMWQADDPDKPDAPDTPVATGEGYEKRSRARRKGKDVMRRRAHPAVE